MPAMPRSDLANLTEAYVRATESVGPSADGTPSYSGAQVEPYMLSLTFFFPSPPTSKTVTIPFHSLDLAHCLSPS